MAEQGPLKPKVEGSIPSRPIAHPRPLNPEERRLLDFLLSKEFEGRDALAKQAASVETGGSSCDCGCPSFSLVPDRDLPSAAVPHGPVAVDAHGRDPGGNEIGVLLFVRDGYLRELEVFGWTESKYAGLPRPEDLVFSEWSAPDENGVRMLRSDD